MHTFMKWVAVVVIPAVFVTAASAEDPAHPEGATVKLILLRQKSVQEELKVDAELKTKIHEFTDKQHEAFLKTKELGAEERKQKHQEMVKENENFLKDSLSEAQLKRLDQITMQFAALHHLLKPEHIKTLKLSDEQVEKLKELQKDSRKALEQLFTAKKREGRNEKLAKHREDTRVKILAILTDDQKTQVRELSGPRFTGVIVLED
jgi:hypothetical protein